MGVDACHQLLFCCLHTSLGYLVVPLPIVCQTLCCHDSWGPTAVALVGHV